MSEILSAFVLGLIGNLVITIITYTYSLKVAKAQNRLEYKTNLYYELFDGIRNLNSYERDLLNLICNAQLFASDEVLDFLDKILDKIQNNQNKKLRFNNDDILELLIIIRKDLGLQHREKSKLNILIQKSKV